MMMCVSPHASSLACKYVLYIVYACLAICAAARTRCRPALFRGLPECVTNGWEPLAEAGRTVVGPNRATGKKNQTEGRDGERHTRDHLLHKCNYLALNHSRSCSLICFESEKHTCAHASDIDLVLGEEIQHSDCLCVRGIYVTF